MPTAARSFHVRSSDIRNTLLALVFEYGSWGEKAFLALEIFLLLGRQREEESISLWGLWSTVRKYRPAGIAEEKAFLKFFERLCEEKEVTDEIAKGLAEESEYRIGVTRFIDGVGRLHLMPVVDVVARSLSPPLIFIIAKG
jgi:uncharacterized membrane protein